MEKMHILIVDDVEFNATLLQGKCGVPELESLPQQVPRTRGDAGSPLTAPAMAEGLLSRTGSRHRGI